MNDIALGSMQALSDLAARTLDDWAAGGAIDWQQAEDLVSGCRGLPAEAIERLAIVSGVIMYADEETEWESGEVDYWPVLIIQDIHESFGIDPAEQEQDLDGLSFDDEEEAEGCSWALLEGARLCFITGGHCRYFAEVGTQSFGPFPTRIAAAREAIRYREG